MCKLRRMDTFSTETPEVTTDSGTFRSDHP